MHFLTGSVLYGFSFYFLQSYKRPQGKIVNRLVRCGNTTSCHTQHCELSELFAFPQLGCRQMCFCVSQPSSTAVHVRAAKSATIPLAAKKKTGTYGEQRVNVELYIKQE